MIYDKKGNIYIVGGNDKKIYKYNINSNEFLKINNEILKIRNNPILYINNDILFVFYGKDEKGFCEKSYEFCKLNNNKNKFKIIHEVKFELEKCGIIEYDNNSILFIGGKNQKYYLKNAIKFNIKNFTMENYYDININEDVIFNENLLQNLGNYEYGNFNEIDSSFMKIQFI
jgi:hypothetical protein